MLSIGLAIWFGLTLASVAYVAWDGYFHNPEMAVMKWGWVLVTLYTGPLGLAFYLLTCKEPTPGTHEEFTRAPWKQAVGSTVHCLAGDATGVIIGSVILNVLHFPMWVDVLLEYILGFLFGLFIFQALFMKQLFGGSYWRALKSSFLPEFYSMNAVMAGMIPVMVWLMSRNAQAMEPKSPLFWAVMSLSTAVGAFVAVPVNYWLVAAGLKHGMSTVRALQTSSHHHLPKDSSLSSVSPPEIFAVGILSLLALTAGTLLAASSGAFASVSVIGAPMQMP